MFCFIFDKILLSLTITSLKMHSKNKVVVNSSIHVFLAELYDIETDIELFALKKHC